MPAVLRVTRFIDELSRIVGLAAVWLVLSSALVSAFNAVFRYSISGMIWLERTYGGGVFGGMVTFYTQYSNVLSESVWYMFGGMVMLGGAWTLKMNEHVRVDLIYGAISERARTWIDLLGGLFFLVPLCLLLIYFTWPWFVQAWTQNVMSNAAGFGPRATKRIPFATSPNSFSTVRNDPCPASAMAFSISRMDAAAPYRGTTH